MTPMTLAEIAAKLPEMLKVHSPDQHFEIVLDSSKEIRIIEVEEDLPVEFCSEEETKAFLAQPEGQEAMKRSDEDIEAGKIHSAKELLKEIETHGSLV